MDNCFVFRFILIIRVVSFNFRLVLAVSRKLGQTGSNGVSRGDAWNNCSVELFRAAQVKLKKIVVNTLITLHKCSVSIKNASFDQELV